MVHDFENEAGPSGSTLKINNYRGDTVLRMHLQLKYLNGTT
jgi:hypothetical protein